MKNLIISTESALEILRLSPQNDITTQAPKGEGISDRLRIDLIEEPLAFKAIVIQ